MLGEINSQLSIWMLSRNKAGMVEETTAATASLKDDVDQLVEAMDQLKTRRNPHSSSGCSEEVA